MGTQRNIGQMWSHFLYPCHSVGTEAKLRALRINYPPLRALSSALRTSNRGAR
jgi:hypothetical protein